MNVSMKIILLIVLSFVLALICSWTAFQSYGWWSVPVCLFMFMGSASAGVSAVVIVMARVAK